jgi:GntR family transcriptional regulator
VNNIINLKKTPLYVQVMDYIKFGIINGEFNSNDKIPSIREMAENLRVNTNTISKAYHNLLLDGVIYKKMGVGYFVEYDKNTIDNLKKYKTNEIVSVFICEMESLNLSSSVIIKLAQHNIDCMEFIK